MKKAARACLFVIGLALIAQAAAGQPYAEFVVRGTLAPQVRKAAEEAVIYSLASMARLGAVLSEPPKVYFVETTTDCVELHVEMGDRRSRGELRCARFAGMTWPGTFVVNMENVMGRYSDPVEAMWWLMPHELWHLYQHQTGMYRLGMPWAFREGVAELHKFRVLYEKRMIDFAAYTARTILPRARRAREGDPKFSIQAVDGLPVELTQEQVRGRYWMAAALGVYLHNEAGGWPKIMALHAEGARSFSGRFEDVYGRPLADFETEFWVWLGRR